MPALLVPSRYLRGGYRAAIFRAWPALVHSALRRLQFLPDGSRDSAGRVCVARFLFARRPLSNWLRRYRAVVWKPDLFARALRNAENQAASAFRPRQRDRRRLAPLQCLLCGSRSSACRNRLWPAVRRHALRRFLRDGNHVSLFPPKHGTAPAKQEVPYRRKTLELARLRRYHLPGPAICRYGRQFWNPRECCALPLCRNLVTRCRDETIRRREFQRSPRWRPRQRGWRFAFRSFFHRARFIFSAEAFFVSLAAIPFHSRRTDISTRSGSV